MGVWILGGIYGGIYQGDAIATLLRRRAIYILIH